MAATCIHSVLWTPGVALLFYYTIPVRPWSSNFNENMHCSLSCRMAGCFAAIFVGWSGLMLLEKNSFEKGMVLLSRWAKLYWEYNGKNGNGTAVLFAAAAAATVEHSACCGWSLSGKFVTVNSCLLGFDSMIYSGEAIKKEKEEKKRGQHKQIKSNI